MAQAIVAHSFAELAEILGLDGPLADRAEDSERVELGDTDEMAAAIDRPANAEEAVPDLAALVAELETASQTLADIARRDHEARAQALRDLDRYDELVARLEEARRGRVHSAKIRSEAEAIARSAFTDEARGAADRVIQLAARAEEATSRTVSELEAETASLGRRLDLERLLAERRREEEAEQRRAAELVRARRLSATLAAAREALETGQLEEAKTLLGPAENEHPDNAELASLKDMITRRALTVKVHAAEKALFGARRLYRQDPAAAVRVLSELDVTDLPAPLSAHVFGEWARAASRLCRERGFAEPLRYAPDPGRGAILAREAEGAPYVVVSALGLRGQDPSWEEGRAAAEWQVRRASPLR